MIHISCVTNETVNLKVRFPSNQHHRPIKFCHSLGRNEQILEHWQFYSSHKSSHTVPRYPYNRFLLFRLRASFFQSVSKFLGNLISCLSSGPGVCEPLYCTCSHHILTSSALLHRHKATWTPSHASKQPCLWTIY